MGLTRTLREEAPSSYSMKLVGYSDIKGRNFARYPYESAVFAASGYQWRLIMYPVGNDKDGGKNHISLYVRLETPVSDLLENWKIQVDMKFFVFNQNQKTYLTVQDGIVKRYSGAKKELGIAQFIEHSMLDDEKNGYIVHDTCILGVEIFLLKPPERLETITFLHNPPNNKFTWKILHFSNLVDQKFFCVRSVRHWTKILRRMRTDPKSQTNGLSAFLIPSGFLPDSVVVSTCAIFKLKILNQRNSNHIEIDVAACYANGGDIGFGKWNLISHKDLYEERFLRRRYNHS